MKQLLFISFLFLSLIGKSQYTVPRGLPSYDTRPFVWYIHPGGFVLIDSALMFNSSDTAMKPLYNAIKFKNNVPYYWDLEKWNAFGSGGGGSSLTIFDSSLIAQGSTPMTYNSTTNWANTSWQWDSMINFQINSPDYTNGFLKINNGDAWIGDFTAQGNHSFIRVNDAEDLQITINSPIRLEANSGEVQFKTNGQNQFYHLNTDATPTQAATFITLKNDSNETAISAYGAQIAGSAAGGAIIFHNSSVDPGNEMLRLGVIDNDNVFSEMMQFHYSQLLGNRIIAPFVENAEIGSVLTQHGDTLYKTTLQHLADSLSTYGISQNFANTDLTFTNDRYHNAVGFGLWLDSLSYTFITGYDNATVIKQLSSTGSYNAGFEADINSAGLVAVGGDSSATISASNLIGVGIYSTLYTYIQHKTPYPKRIILGTDSATTYTSIYVRDADTIKHISLGHLRADLGAGTGSVTSVALTVPTGLSVSGSPVTTSGTLAITTTLNGVIHGNGSGFTASNVNLASEVTGTLPIANGGTNLTTYTTGDLPYASASNVLSKLAIGSTSQVLTVSGGIPSWATPTTTNTWALTYFTPTTGSTIVAVAGTNVVEPAGSLDALTVTLPTTPANGTICTFSFVTAITTLTFSGGTLANNITSTAAGGTVAFIYRTSNTKWYVWE